MRFTTGYNLLLNIEDIEDIPDGFRKMSIIQLLRDMRGGRKIPRDVAVVGLDTLLISSENSRESRKYLTAMLRANNKRFREGENTFLFIPRNELYVDNDIYCKIGEKRISISPVFAGRLQISDVGIYHADFEF